MAVSSRTLGVRRAALSDAVALARLERKGFTGYYAAHRFSETQFRSYLNRAPTIAFVAVAGSALGGYALGIQNTGSRRHIARLHSIVVDPAVRARSVGARLLRAFLADARRRGCRRAYLEVADGNTPAIALFERHGFTTIRRLRSFYGPTADGLRMRCDLRDGVRRRPRR